MSAQAPATSDPTLERDWWLRTLAVLQSPKAVFAWLRDESDQQAEARQEPVLALVVLAGISGILSLDATGTLLDYPTNGNLPLETALVPVIVFIQGALYGAAAFWIGGGVVHLGLRGAGATGRYRQTRHLLAYAASPLVLSLLVVWPLKLALYGGDAFRTGGGDADGTGSAVFRALELGAVAWAALLLVIGIRTVHGWSVPRSIGALGLGAFVLLGLSLVALILSAG